MSPCLVSLGRSPCLDTFEPRSTLTSSAVADTAPVCRYLRYCGWVRRADYCRGKTQGLLSSVAQAASCRTFFGSSVRQEDDLDYDISSGNPSCISGPPRRQRACHVKRPKPERRLLHVISQTSPPTASAIHFADPRPEPDPFLGPGPFSRPTYWTEPAYRQPQDEGRRTTRRA